MRATRVGFVSRVVSVSFCRTARLPAIHSTSFAETNHLSAGMARRAAEWCAHEASNGRNPRSRPPSIGFDDGFCSILKKVYDSAPNLPGKRRLIKRTCLSRCILDAMNQPTTLSPQALDRYRNYLQLLAKAEIAPQIRRRVEPSDMVQETLIEAFQKREQFTGQTEGELAQWLRKILLHNVLDATRAVRRKKRDVGREQVLGGMLHDSASHLAGMLAADQTSPSQKASNVEQVVRLADALSQLPQDQQDAVVLHHLQGKSLAELSAELDRSQTAVAGLLYRGLKRLRSILTDSDS